jgi:hypothetical protein
MGRETTPKMGLTLDDHRDLGDQLRSIRADLLEIRATVKTAVGSATIAYQTFQRALNGVAAVEHALAAEAAGEYSDQVPKAELQRLYGEDSGKEPV